MCEGKDTGTASSYPTTETDLALLYELALKTRAQNLALSQHLFALLGNYRDAAEQYASVTTAFDEERKNHVFTPDEQICIELGIYDENRRFKDGISLLFGRAFQIAVTHYQAVMDITKLIEPHQTVLAINEAQGMIDNGGFQYFFESNFPDNPPYTIYIDAFRRIGADDAAFALQQAVARFPFPNPHLEAVLRNKYMYENSGDDLGTHVFDDLDCICGASDNYTKAVDYIVLRLSAFQPWEEPQRYLY